MSQSIKFSDIKTINFNSPSKNLVNVEPDIVKIPAYDECGSGINLDWYKAYSLYVPELPLGINWINLYFDRYPDFLNPQSIVHLHEEGEQFYEMRHGESISNTSIIHYDGYEGGSISFDSTIAHGNIRASISPARVKTYELTLASLPVGVESYTVTRIPGLIGAAEKQSFTVPGTSGKPIIYHGDTLTVSVVAKSGFNPAESSFSNLTNNRVVGPSTLTVTSGGPKQFELKISGFGTEIGDGCSDPYNTVEGLDSITVRVIDSPYANKTGSFSVGYDGTIPVYYGDKLTATVYTTASHNGYLNWTTYEVGNVQPTELIATVAIKTFTVEFKSNNSNWGSVSTSKIEKVPYGSYIQVDENNIVTIDGFSTTVTASATPDTAQYDYEFTGWTGAVGAVTSDKVVTANFTQTVKNYIITFTRNESWGTISESGVIVPYGTTWVVDNTNKKITLSTGKVITATPNSNTTQYKYGFNNWTQSTSTNKVEGNVTITANFTRQLQTYDVEYPAKVNNVATFKIYKGSTLVVDNPSSSGKFTAIYGETVYAIATSPTGFNEPTIEGIGTSSSSPTTVTGKIIITLQAGSVKRYILSIAGLDIVNENCEEDIVYDSHIESVTITRKSSPLLGGSQTTTTATYDKETSYIYVYHGDELTASIITDTGYDGYLSWTSKTVTENLVLNASATLKTFTLYYPAKPATVSSYYISRSSSPYAEAGIGTIVTGGDSAGSITVYYGDKLSISAYAKEGYSVPTYSLTATEALANITATVTGGTILKYNLNIPALKTGITSCSITRTPSSSMIGAAAKETFAATSSEQNKTIYYGDSLTITSSAHTAYTNPDCTLSSSYVTDNVSATINAGSVKEYTLTVNGFNSEFDACDTWIANHTPGLNSISVNVNKSPYKGWTGIHTLTYDDNIKLYYGDEITVSIVTHEAYTGSLNWTSKTIYSDETLTGTSTIKTYKLTMGSKPTGVSSYTVYRSSSPYGGVAASNLNNNAILYYGDVLTAGASATEGYTNPTLNWTNWSKVTSDVTSTITAGTIKEFKLTISSKPNGVATHTVTRTGSTLKGAPNGELENNATIYYGDQLTAVATAVEGFMDPTLNWTSITKVTGNVTSTATASPVKSYILYIEGLDEVDCGDNIIYESNINYIRVTRKSSALLGTQTTTTTDYYTNDYIYVYHGDEITASIVGDECYNASLNWTSKTITGSTTLTGSASIKTFTVTFNTNNSYGTIDRTSIANVPCGSGISVNGNKVTIYGTTVTATPKADTAQYDYEFSSWSNTSGSITANRTIIANFADPKVFNYTVTIKAVNGTASPSSVVVPYGTTWSVSENTVNFSDGQKSTITPNPTTAQYSYAFSNWSPTSGTVTGNTTITGTCKGTLRSYTVSYPAKPTGVATFNVYHNGTAINKTDAAGSFSANYGDKVYATATASTGYESPSISGVTTSSSGTEIKGATSITLTRGPVITYTLAVTGFPVWDPCDGLIDGNINLKSITVTRTPGLEGAAAKQTVTFTENDSIPVYHGDAVTASATVENGYNISLTWTSKTISGPETLTYSSISLKTYTLTIVNGSYGTVKRGSTTLSNEDSITHFDTLTITPKSVAGYTYTVSSPTGTISNGQLTVDGPETIIFGGGGNTYYVYYKQGLASSATNLPSTQSRVYPNSTIVSTNSMTKTNTTANSYTATYKQGNASSTTNLPSVQTSINTTTYTANAWTTSSSATNTVNYANGASINSAADVTLYPNFTTSTTNGGLTLSSNNMTRNNTTSNGYTVSYLSGTASDVPGPPCGDLAPPTMPTAQTATDTTSYTHSGWSTSQSGSKTYNKGASTGAMSSNITLYPYFDSSLTRGSVTLATNDYIKDETSNGTYTITYNYNGGSGSPASASATRVIRYTANGWTTTSGSTTRNYTNGQSVQVTSNITLYPCFSQTNYTYPVTLPTSSRPGYTFSGWYTADGTKVGNGGDSYTPTGNVTLYAGWPGNTYTVTYNKGLATGGTLPTPNPQNRTYPNATTIATNSMTKSNTTQTGYTLSYAKGLATSGTLPSSTSAADTVSYTANGWTTGSSNTNDPDYANGASFGANSTTNLVLYPNFTTSLSRGSVTTGTNNMTKTNGSSSSYTVTYNKGTATHSIDPCDGRIDPYVPIAQTSTNTIKYTANGWTTGSSNTNDRDYSNGATISNFSSALTLYPNFTTSATNNGVTLASSSDLYKDNTTANSYTVTYYQGNASSTTNLPSKQTSQNETTYTSDGWTTTSGSTTRTYANGASTGALTANLTLYPCFKQSTTNKGVTLSSNTMSKSNTTANGYTVTYKQGSATSTTVPSAQTQTNTTTYTHGGWATSASGSKAYNKGAATGALSANLSLYPYFSSSTTNGSIKLASNSMTKSNTTDSSYTVTYNYNGSGASNTTATATVTRSYTANGWTTTSGSTTRSYTNGQTITPTGNITLYPCFSQSTSGGSVTLPTPTRTGHTFNGWYTAASGGTKIGAGGASYKPSANITLYAQWTAVAYTLTIAAMSTECGDSLMPNVNSITVNRTSCPSGRGSTGTIATSSMPNASTVTATVYYGDVISVSATPSSSCYTATPNWTSTTITGTPTTITASASSRNITVTFSMAQSGYGTISKTSLTVPCGSYYYTSGNTLYVNGTAITASPATTTAQYSYAFSSWSPSGSGYIHDHNNGITSFVASFTRTTRSYTISYPAKPTGVANFVIYLNGSAKVSNPTSAGSFTASYGAKVYATATAATNYGTPSVGGVTTSSSGTTVTGNISITCTAGAYTGPQWRTILSSSKTLTINAYKSGSTSASVSGLKANTQTKITFSGGIEHNTNTNPITQRTNAESSNGIYSGSGTYNGDGGYGFTLTMNNGSISFSAYADGYVCDDCECYEISMSKAYVTITNIQQYY